MSPWSAEHYLRFAGERTQPARDLCGRIAVDAPRRVIDLGCGPGNSTAVLRQRWPDADLVGLDSSADMIDVARQAHTDWTWVQSPIESWHPDQPFDVVFSNAALQWVPDHGRLVRVLFSHVAHGGALAFQIPSATFAAVRTLIHETAQAPQWVERMTDALQALTMETPAFYYDVLAPVASRVELWETEYIHVMASHAAIIDWMSSTGLRPFLDALASADERAAFLSQLRSRIGEAYDIRPDGTVLFPFRRTFVVAYALS